MTSAQIRQSFLDFFREKQHSIVPSSSLLPDAPNLLFTNAGMNQFVPIFLGQQKPSWKPPRVADTQKCIRAGGKHNDLEDVGLDTYHHTFFEMLGNWSFGDYFKKEAIEWAWELLVERWKFPAQRLYATVYCPHLDPGRWSRELEACVNIVKGGPARVHWDDEVPDQSAINRSDRESIQYWANLFLKAKLEPQTHIIPGGRKDNFWMMGDTGPCGPCSEVHIDLTPDGDTHGELVNKEDPVCIEIWNLVFIQFNASADGTFAPLPQSHVDTGMGFERVTAMIQGTKNLTDFSRTISNYETDVFRPIFDELEKLSGKKYESTIPKEKSAGENEQEKIDIAFRVIGDHIRALSFAIADGIIPSNESRGYVLRRILRRAVRYGRTLGFHEPFFFKLVDVVAKTMGDVFPEVRTTQFKIREIVRREEESFNKTLDNGIAIFEEITSLLDSFNRASRLSKPLIERIRDADEEFLYKASIPGPYAKVVEDAQELWRNFRDVQSRWWYRLNLAAPNLAIIYTEQLADSLEGIVRHDLPASILTEQLEDISHKIQRIEDGIQFGLSKHTVFPGTAAFLLYDEQGFPLDLTQLMARERGLTVDVEGFNRLMAEQKAKARSARRRETIEISPQTVSSETNFVGYRAHSVKARVVDVVDIAEKQAVLLNKTPFYAEMGGQVGDTGKITDDGTEWTIVDTQRRDGRWLHFLADQQPRHPHTSIFTNAANIGDLIGNSVTVSVDAERRRAIERHHSATHILHWALREIVGREATQRGSYVGPKKLTFDFQSQALTSDQVMRIEQLVNERVLENARLWSDYFPYDQIRNHPKVMQFFVEKYGDIVRVVQIGGNRSRLNGYSIELCGGTHVERTGEIGLFRILSESGISTGVRRIEAVAGLEAYEDTRAIVQSHERLAEILKTQAHDIEKRLENVLEEKRQLEKAQASSFQREAAIYVKEHCQFELVGNIPAWIHLLPLRERGIILLQNVLDVLKSQRFQGVAILVGVDSTNTVQLAAYVSPDLITRIQAKKIIEKLAPIVGGKGGGRPESARGAGKDVSKINQALDEARKIIGGP